VSATHSANPVTWGQQVIRAVQGCGDQAGRAAAGGSRPGVCAPVRVLGGSQEGRDDGRPGAKGSAGPTSSPSSDGQQGQHGNGPTTAPGRSRDRNQGGEPAPDSEKDKPRKKDVEASPSP